MFYCGKNLVKYGDRAAVTDETGAALLDGVSFPDNRALCEKPMPERGTPATRTTQEALAPPQARAVITASPAPTA